jgi:hypothetical protein
MQLWSPVMVTGRTPLLLALAGGLGAPAFAQSYPTDPGDLTVTEFMSETDVVANYYGEWFEVYNASGRNLDLNGLTIRGGRSGEAFSVAGTVLLSAGSYVVFVTSADPDDNGGVDYDGLGIDYYPYDRFTDDFDLDETGDTIGLYYGSLLLDEVVWDSVDWTLSRDYSLQANLNAYRLEWANDLSHNWCDSTSTISGTRLRGTPGDPNEYCVGSNTDGDGDGYSEAAGDCDDEDPYIHSDVGADYVVDGDGAPYGNADDDANCDGVRDDGLLDGDGDGYTPVEGDCDDEQGTVYPDAVEILDGIDNDCNGCIDDSDDDNDGWTECDTGTSEVCELCDGCTELDCLTNPNLSGCLVVLAYDCDDSDNFVYPCANETPYDGLDQDCDLYDLCDVDDDGYEAEECPKDSVQFPEKERDCDDSDPAVNPNASEGDPETGGTADGKDNDCNGVVDDPYQDQDGDGYTVLEGDCLDDPSDPNSQYVNPKATEVCDDLYDNDCNGFFNDGCDNARVYASAKGGGLCASAPGDGPGAGGGALLLMLTLLGALLRARPRGV